MPKKRKQNDSGPVQKSTGLGQNGRKEIGSRGRRAHSNKNIVENIVPLRCNWRPAPRIFLVAHPSYLVVTLGADGHRRACDSDSATRSHGLEIFRGQGLAPDAPLSTGHVVDTHPGHPAHDLAFDGDHCVSDPPDHVLLFLGAEDAFDDLDIYQGHFIVLSLIRRRGGSTRLTEMMTIGNRCQPRTR